MNIKEKVKAARLKHELDQEVKVMNRSKMVSPRMMTTMKVYALTMRPQLNDNQLGEVINRALAEFETHWPEDFEEVVMRVEFHADDVLGYGDEEYAYSGEE
jgi:hypothetical protein